MNRSENNGIYVKFIENTQFPIDLYKKIYFLEQFWA